MKQYLLTIEFRYSDQPKDDNEYPQSKTKVLTVGVYDTYELAMEAGNNVLPEFEKRYPLNKHWNVKERFSKNGGGYGMPKDLITDLAYLQTNFQFFAKITTLTYQDINSVLDEVDASVARYRKYKTTEGL